MAGQIHESRVIAERVSRTVRQLDEAQMNVQQALALVEDVVNLKGCATGVVGALRENDLVGATGYVRQFHDIASAAAQASDDYERMLAAERMLQDRVLEEFHRATAVPEVLSGGKEVPEGGNGKVDAGGGEGFETKAPVGQRSSDVAKLSRGGARAGRMV